MGGFIRFSRGDAAATRRNKRKHEVAKEKRASKKEAAKALLLPGESLIPSYSHKAALCDCEPTHEWRSFLPAMPVARSKQHDRCIRCNKRWTVRAYEWSRAFLLPDTPRTEPVP